MINKKEDKSVEKGIELYDTYTNSYKNGLKKSHFLSARHAVNHCIESAVKSEAEKWHNELRQLQKYETERVKSVREETAISIIKALKEFFDKIVKGYSNGYCIFDEEGFNKFKLMVFDTIKNKFIKQKQGEL